MPTSTARPWMPSDCTAWRMVSGRPISSRATSTPRPPGQPDDLRDRVDLAAFTGIAPNCAASASLSGLMSTA